MTDMPSPIASTALACLLIAAPFAAGALMFQATGPGRGQSTLPPVPVPDGNPITEEKRLLGKILFFDEQLSTDNTVSCATCHQSPVAGADPRIALSNPGPDGILGNADDIRASLGVLLQNIDTDYAHHPVYAFTPQVTDRAANSVINAAFATELFWDGRAAQTFTDPLTGQVVLTEHAALESQAVQPPFDPVEMAHHGRAWPQVTSKLAHARPLALASNLPADINAEILDARTYPELFRRAFGDPAITPARIAKALATYQRTLISDETPWDAYMAGDLTAMTEAQVRGWQVFQSGTARCAQCHTPPLFTDNSFRNIGIRPVIEDPGRQLVTGDPDDAGRFKVPGLRNSVLKRTFMHTGRLSNLDVVITFYAGNGQNMDNIDPLVPDIQVSAAERADLVAFLSVGLTDPRVRDGVFPFDAPDLFFRPGVTPNPTLLPGAGRPDSQGRTPSIIARTPPLIGTDDFRIGVSNIAPGATATLVASWNPPVSGEISPDLTVATVTASTDPNPAATADWAIPFSPALDGKVRFLQWRIHDPNQAQPALSRVARITYFCGFGNCATGCLADFDRNNRVDFFDLAAFLTAYTAQQPAADLAEPLGVYNFFDVAAFVSAFSAGCP